VNDLTAGLVAMVKTVLVSVETVKTKTVLKRMVPAKFANLVYTVTGVIHDVIPTV
jgi:hypothetical protein